jgi:hypothetical protein
MIRFECPLCHSRSQGEGDDWIIRHREDLKEELEYYINF